MWRLALRVPDGHVLFEIYNFGLRDHSTLPKLKVVLTTMIASSSDSGAELD